ncbi:MAG: carbohydrate-binding domain-containing protein [Oscillospiraceae bacterium]
MKFRILPALLCMTLCFLLLPGCASGAAAQTAPAADETVLAFSGKSLQIAGSGASIDDDGAVSIDAGGIYRITGTSGNARIEVSANNDLVTLILDGCDLTYEDDEVIYIKSAGSAVVELADGTENVLTSGVEILPLADETASGAALRAKCPLTIRGSGSLTVNGFLNNGIASNDDITVESGRIAVAASNDGIKSKTDISIGGGTIDITASQDAVQADGGLTVTGGELNIVSGGGANETAMKTSDSAMMGGPRRDPSSEQTTETASDDMGDSWDFDTTDSGSQKGLKSETGIVIAGGSITLNTADDAVHSGGDISISDGTLLIRAGDDGIHSDTALTIDGGSIDIQLAYEGLEAPSIIQNAGYVSIVAKDDGLNANGGGMFPFPSGEASGETDSSDMPLLRVTGGTLIVDSGGDGLDSNGNLYVEGGLVYVSGPSTNWDAALDSGERGELIFSGGTVMAAGYSGMMESPEAADNAQPAIYYTQSEYCPDGTSVTLTDADGNLICEYAFAHSFNCVVITSPDIQVGQTYTLTMGDNIVSIEMTDTITSNRMRGGPGGSGEPGASREPSAEPNTQA